MQLCSACRSWGSVVSPKRGDRGSLRCTATSHLGLQDNQLTCPSGSSQPWEAACYLPFGRTVMVLGLDVMQDLHFCTRAVGPGWEEQY